MKNFESLSRLIRYYILTSTTAAGSGHPTSSMSATDLMTVLWFGGYLHFDFKDRDNTANDRMIFSKGHASPLYYSLFLAAGVITPEEIMTLRKFDSRLEGHPTPRFEYTEAATGSLGQGLGVGVGMALAQRKAAGKEAIAPKTFVLLGDGELAEGSVWEAAEIASTYKLNNLVAIADINRLGQSQETMLGWDTETYKKRFEAFGWEAIVVDGHNFEEINTAFSNHELRKTNHEKPYVIIAKTEKGKGVSFLANKDGWHGKALPKDQLDAALKELGEVDLKLRGTVAKIQNTEDSIQNTEKKSPNSEFDSLNSSYKLGDSVATRKAYGEALAKLGAKYLNIVGLDAEVKNSSYAEIFKKAFPDRFYEMFIAEQNMVSVAGGMSKLGYIPFVSTFACFLTRGFDQMRMAALSEFNVKFAGSHAGVSIGEDGPSQMALEDLAMFRSLYGSTVLYPADAVATEKLIEEMIKVKGISYIRTTRGNTSVIYGQEETFKIGGSKVHKIRGEEESKKAKKKVLIVTAGITLYEALKAQKELIVKDIELIVMDAYSIKPIDSTTLVSLSHQVEAVVTVEDHWMEGGIGDAVLEALAGEKVAVHKIAVTKMPRSGTPSELLAYEEIDAAGISKKIVSIASK